MEPRALKNITIAAFIMAMLWALAIAVCIGTCQGVPLERLAWQSRADTVWQAHRTALTDTLERLDSIIRVRQERK